MSGKRLSPSDAMFLYGESRETMMHVAGMLPFTPAPGTPPDHLRDLMDEVREAPVLAVLQSAGNAAARVDGEPRRLARGPAR